MTKTPPQARLGEDNWQSWAYQAAPLFKWAGGKRRFILGNANRFPEFDGVYHEPFAGSLAVYFWMASKSELPLEARVSDVNVRLIRTFQEVKHEPEKVWELLDELIQGFKRTSDPSAYYYRVREEFNASRPKADAARFIFLMSTGWNGVYRTNSQGGFNVPFGGGEKTPRFPSEVDLFIASTVLQHCDIRSCSWETSLNATKAGDFVFLDPPYLTSEDGDSNIYEKDKPFSFSDHERLAIELVRQQERGVEFLLTNSVSKQLISMYQDLGLSVDVVSSRRSISGKSEVRGVEGELVVTPGNNGIPRKKLEDDFDFNIFLLQNRKVQS